MKKYLSLIKLLFVQQYRVKPTEGKRRRAGTIAAYIVLAVCFLPMLIGLAGSMYLLGSLSKGLENVENIAATLLFVCQGVVLLFGVQTLITNVFSAKDADKLLFLPVRSSTIFAAKLTVAYLNEVITTAVMLIFTLLPFGIGYSAQAWYYLLLIPALLLVPLLPMLVSAIIAIPLSAIITKLGKNGVVKTVLQVVMFAIIMGVYLLGMYELGFIGGSGDADGGSDLANILLEKLQSMGGAMKYVHSDFTLASAMLGASFGAVMLNLLISLAENALLFGLVLLLSVPFYHWMLSSSVESAGGGRRKRVKPSDLAVKNQGVVKELIFTDIKRVMRESQMGFQCILSLIMLPLMVVVFYFCFSITGEGEQSVVAMLQGQALYQGIAPVVFLAYMSLLGMSGNVLGIYPISRENKSIYLVKSLPVPFNKYLLAKVILSTSAMLISDFLMCLLTVVLFGIEWYFGIAMLLVMGALGFGAMCITTLIDLKSPKLGWTNFNQSLKNAKNSWMAMLVGLVVSVIIGIISAVCLVGWYFLNAAWYMLLIMWLAIIGASVGFAAVCYRIMTGSAEKYFNLIEP